LFRNPETLVICVILCSFFLFHSTFFSDGSEESDQYYAADERGGSSRRQLPPSGISTNEYYDRRDQDSRRYQDSLRTSPHSSSTPSPYGSNSASNSASSYWQASPDSGSRGRSSNDIFGDTVRVDNTTYGSFDNFEVCPTVDHVRFPF